MAKPRTITPTIVNQEVTVDPGNIAASTCLDVTVTVPGLRVGYPVHVWMKDLEANVGGPHNAHCSSANTLKFRLCNDTASGINPASQSIFVTQR